MDLDALVREAVAEVPGAAVAVLRAGERPLVICHGLANVEWDAPVGPDTVFRLASVSKPFTGLTALLLARDGVLDLDAPIGRHLPDFADRAGVTIRHLLTHTSGLQNFVTRPDFLATHARRDFGPAELREYLATMATLSEPGRMYSYSNTNYRLVELAIAEAGGEPFAEVLARRVFGPAGMVHARVLDERSLVPRRAAGYEAGPEGGGPVNPPYVNMSVPGAAGGLGATLDDLIAFDGALDGGVFGDLSEAYEPLTLLSGRREGYGLGWAINSYRGHRVLGHAGGIQGFSTLYARLPEDGLSVVVLTNLDGFRCSRVVRLAVDTLLDLPPVDRAVESLPPERVAARAGVYREPLGDLEVGVLDGGIGLTAWDMEFQPVRDDFYVCATDGDVTLRFHDAERAVTIGYPLFWQTFYAPAG